MKNLLNHLIIFTFLMISANLGAQELPRPSQKQSLTQRIGLTDITIEYSRPNAKGREIFGGLVPYDKIWRTGANEATTIEFDDYVTIQGQTVPPGKYAVFTKPMSEGVWEVMFNSDWDQWGTGKYDPNKDLLKVTAQVRQMNDYTETFTINFDNVLGDQAILYLNWANTRVELTVEVNSKSKALENIQKKIKEMENTFGAYNTIASYYLRENIDPGKALEYAKLSVNMQETYWNLKTLSEAYAANGMYKDAIETAEKSLQLAKDAGSTSYIKADEENIAKWKSMK